jgi:transposase-like protein
LRSALVFRFQLSLRDIEELLFEHGVIACYKTVRRWHDKFGASFAHRVKAARHEPGTTWHFDEVFVTLRGEQSINTAPNSISCCRSVVIKPRPGGSSIVCWPLS